MPKERGEIKLWAVVARARGWQLKWLADLIFRTQRSLADD